MDIEVIVNTNWTGPNGASLREQELVSSPVMMINTTRYESTAVFGSVQVSDSGEYSCTVTINSLIEFITGNPVLSETEDIVVGRIDNYNMLVG